MTINWRYYPPTEQIPDSLLSIVDIFAEKSESIKSPNDHIPSNKILEILCDPLENIGYSVEKNKTKEGLIKIPVLFGECGTIIKSFNVDAYNKSNKVVIEVEAGRAVDNNQFLKDLFEACMMHNVDYLTIAVCNYYKCKRNGKYAVDKDYENVSKFLETLYFSNRLNLPLKGILLIGY